MYDRRSVFAQQETTRILDEISIGGGLLPGGGFERPVIRDYLSRYQDLVATRAEEYHGMKLSSGFLREELRRVAKFSPKRWEHTSERFKDRMVYFSVKGDPAHWNDFTLWIGESLIEQSINSKKPLAALLLKRLEERVVRAFPGIKIGFWLNIERKEYDAMALHAHGAIVCDDPAVFLEAKNRRRLGQLMRDAATPLSRMRVQRQLDMRRREVNLGWWRYCMKQRPSLIVKTGKRMPPPSSIGKRVNARSHYVTQRARSFYARARLVVRGVQTGAIAAWTDEKWSAVQP